MSEAENKKHIDGKKIEYVIREIYDIFEKNKVTPNEGCAIAGMIIASGAAGVAIENAKK